jgi:ubiquinone/menaquinone biosynthesis C-methylase UbiE
MGGRDSADRIAAHWEREGLASSILRALVASGADLDALTIGDLAPLDQFHGGGIGFTRRLAQLGGLAPGTRVLDVGGGLGGPARTLAAEFGCEVTVIDLAASYVEAGRMLSALVRLEDRVSFHVGDALELPFADGAFDVVWTQNSGMNIADKERLYAGFRRVVRAGGRLVMQEPMAGPVQPPIYPLTWADDPASSHLRTPSEMRTVIEGTGFRQLAWEEVVVVRAAPAAGDGPASPTIQSLVAGADRLAELMRAAERNDREQRTVMVHAVFAAEPAP